MNTVYEGSFFPRQLCYGRISRDHELSDQLLRFSADSGIQGDRCPSSLRTKRASVLAKSMVPALQHSVLAYGPANAWNAGWSAPPGIFRGSPSPPCRQTVRLPPVDSAMRERITDWSHEHLGHFPDLLQRHQGGQRQLVLPGMQGTGAVGQRLRQHMGITRSANTPRFPDAFASASSADPART